ncbi:MAG: hypothetical protein NXY57DRAFT_1063508 [Lentinula lateritia]|nr:MAG: hypothetical protein NXY57DRAFT_1063508 [Lentinula lateritia]
MSLNSTCPFAAVFAAFQESAAIVLSSLSPNRRIIISISPKVLRLGTGSMNKDVDVCIEADSTLMKKRGKHGEKMIHLFELPACSFRRVRVGVFEKNVARGQGGERRRSLTRISGKEQNHYTQSGQNKSKVPERYIEGFERAGGKIWVVSEVVTRGQSGFTNLWDDKYQVRSSSCSAPSWEDTDMICSSTMNTRYNQSEALEQQRVRIAPLFTTSSTFVQPITGKGPPFRHLLSTNEAPRLFMLIEHDALPSFSSDPLSLLSECSHLTSFDSIPSIPPPTVSLALEASNQQALQAESRDVQLDAVTRYICNVGFGGAGKGDRRGHYPTPHGPVARTKESPGTLKAASNMAWKFQLDDRDCEDVFIRSNSTDKNIRNENYTKGQEGQHPQSLSPSSGDTVLSCWEPGPQFSYHGCDLEVFGPTPYHRGSSTIPDRENDPVVHQHVGRCYTRRIQNSCYAPRMHNKVLTPDPLNVTQVQMRKVEDLEKVTDKLMTGVPAGSLLFSK